MSAPSSFKASLMLRMVARSSRNKSWLDKLCRKMINKAVARPPEDDFMRDELIDNDLGFDPDELDRFQRGQ